VLYRFIDIVVNMNMKLETLRPHMPTQPKIVSASRRTDIPAFYAPWFMNRIREGVALYPNPLFPGKIHRVDLTPKAVNGIVFWTRYPKPLMPYLKELDQRGYAYYFLITILNYPREIEPRRVPIQKSIETVHALSQIIGPERVIWRYDPVMLASHKIDRSFHVENFSRLCEALAPSTRKVIVSVIDPYQKALSDLKRWNISFNRVDYEDLFLEMVRISRKAGLTLQSCAEPFIKIPGVVPGRCVDAELIETLSGKKTSKAAHVQRKGCLCQKSVDIGIAHTCLFGCRYCYASSLDQIAQNNYRKHDPNSPRLIQTPHS
jgi:DNA repair photolyase